MHSRILLAAVCLLLSSSTALAEPSGYGQRTVEEITNRIRVKDCAGAVDDLKAALKKDFPEVAMLAGGMYENGICVKRDWERAVPFYIQAWQGGIRDGADRLAAGYADPANGPDAAAALWWASRNRNGNRRLYGIKGCAVRKADADDMDRFVADLKAWPQARLQACTYMVGVMSTLEGEVKYPTIAYIYRASGDVRILFLPGVPRIELQKGGSSAIEVHDLASGDNASERPGLNSTSFEQAMGYVADRALRRYPHPDGIPAETEVKLDYHFRLLIVNK
jgi:hypothetical protein